MCFLVSRFFSLTKQDVGLSEPFLFPFHSLFCLLGSFLFLLCLLELFLCCLGSEVVPCALWNVLSVIFAERPLQFVPRIPGGKRCGQSLCHRTCAGGQQVVRGPSPSQSWYFDSVGLGTGTWSYVMNDFLFEKQLPINCFLVKKVSFPTCFTKQLWMEG